MNQNKRLALYFALAFYFLYWSALLFPELARAIYHYTQINILELMGSDVPIGPGKIRLFKWLGTIVVSLFVLSLILNWKDNRYRKSGIVMLLVVACHVFLSLKLLDQVRWDRYLAIRISNFPDIDFPRFFSSKQMPSQFDDLNSLYRFSMKQFEKHSRELKSRWHLDDPVMLKAIYLMNFTAGFFSNYSSDINSTTCIPVSMYTDPEKRSHLVRLLMMPDKGCCKDSVFLFHYLLSRAGIENRVLSNKGHIWSEVNISGHWMTMDSTLNLMVNKPYDRIDFSDPTTKVSTFPHPYMVESENNYFNPTLGGARIAMIISLMDDSRFPTAYPTVIPYMQK